MRRTTTTTTLTVLGLLALTGCGATAPAAAPTSTGTAVAAGAEPTDLLDCSPQLKKALDADLFDTSACWTSADVPTNSPDQVITRGETVFALLKTRNSPGQVVVARNAAEGKKLWASAAFEDVAPSHPSSIEIHDISDGDTAAIAVGYKLATEGYRVVTLDPKTGKELSKNDFATVPSKVTWGSGAVALTSYENEVATLTLDGSGFKVIQSLAVGKKHVIYVTKNRIVLEAPLQSTTGSLITDASGAEVATLPKDVKETFCGNSAFVMGSAEKTWIGLTDGKALDKPDCKAGDYFRSFSGGDVQVSDAGFISPDGKTVAVPGAGIYSTSEAKVIPFDKGYSMYGISNTRGYHPLVTYALSTGEAVAHKDMTGLSGVGVVGSADGGTGVFKGDWGIGGARLK
jgi:hypothetical protein